MDTLRRMGSSFPLVMITVSIILGLSIEYHFQLVNAIFGDEGRIVRYERR